MSASGARAAGAVDGGGRSSLHGLGSVRTRGFAGACAHPSSGGLRCMHLGGGGRLPSTQGTAGQHRVTGRTRGSRASDTRRARSSHADRVLAPSHRI